jgi:hypothetical protein
VDMGKTMSIQHKMKRRILFLAPVLFAVILLPPTIFGSSATPKALVGKWAGRVSSVSTASFAVTIEIGPDSKAHIVGEGSPCFTEADLVVTTSGPESVTLAGSSKAHENVTFKGTLDGAEKQLDVTYIVNGSGSARCETDRGSGTLEKQ